MLEKLNSGLVAITNNAWVCKVDANGKLEPNPTTATTCMKKTNATKTVNEDGALSIIISSLKKENDELRQNLLDITNKNLL